MTRKQSLITEIVEIEWSMFQSVPNIGGRASCQDDWKTFEIMRSSQAASWSEAALESYLNDLKHAEKSSRNLLTEKYAQMMKFTRPSEYARIEHLLPPIDPEVTELVDRILAIVLEWEKKLSQKYPNIMKKGRPLFRTEDTIFATSLETYLRGELVTYSRRTLELYLANVLQQCSENINGSEISLAYTVKRYGFKSLEEANEKLKPRT
jgi:hypothetical protein